MMSAFGGLSSPCGSCLLDLPQPWVLKLPLLGLRVLPCTPEGWGRCRGQGEWAPALLWRVEAVSPQGALPSTSGFSVFPSLPPFLLVCSFIQSLIRSFDGH